jgi:hypothetical protein
LADCCGYGDEQIWEGISGLDKGQYVSQYVYYYMELGNYSLW